MLDIIIKACPVCGKEPVVYREHSYEAMGYGAWCVIRCKPFLGHTHLKIECGKSTWERAFEEAVNWWNETVGERLGAQEE